MMASGRSNLIARSGAFTGLPSWLKSPALRCWKTRACNSISAGAAMSDELIGPGDHVKAESTSGAAFASVVRVLGRFQFTRHLAGDRLRRLDLFHQVVVPGALDFEMRRGAELDRLDQIVRHVGVDAGLLEGVERGARRPAADEPGLEIGLRRIGELAGLPHVIAMAADQMR